MAPPIGNAAKQIGAAQAVQQRFQVHPLQTLQRRESSFSKVPTCFEAQLSLLEPELNDARDYNLIVQNERGTTSATVRVRVTTPLSPALMISSAFVFICALFLLSLLFLFVFKRRQHFLSCGSIRAASQQANNGGVQQAMRNGSTTNTNGSYSKRAAKEHLAEGANGKLVANGHPQMSPDGQQTRGVVQGVGNGLANNASNPLANQAGDRQTNSAQLDDDGEQTPLGKSQASGLMSMASSETSCNDQRQLLANCNSSAASSTSGGTAGLVNSVNPGALHAHHDFSATLGRCHASTGGSRRSAGHSTDRSSADSTPRSSTPMNHISVDDELQLNGSYQATESVTTSARLSPMGLAKQPPGAGLIYANIDYATGPNHRCHNEADGQQTRRSNVSATIAMMNDLAAAAATANPTAAYAAPTSGALESGALSGAINQQLACSTRRNQQPHSTTSSAQVRRPGPPKPPKPSMQMRSRFYQQVQQANNVSQGGGQSSPSLAGDLVMIGNGTSQRRSSPISSTGSIAVGKQPASGDELVAEYSRFAFPARAEL